MGILISVKYQAPTNHRGARWAATMTNRRGGKVRASVPFQYGDDEDSAPKEAALKVLRKYCEAYDVLAPRWDVDYVGEDHRREMMFLCRAVWRGPEDNQ